MSFDERRELYDEHNETEERYFRYSMLGIFAFGVALFCLIRQFWIGVLVALIIRIWIAFVISWIQQQLRILHDRLDNEL